MSRKNRTRILTIDDRRLIVRLVKRDSIPQKKCAEMFGVSQARISQIVNDYYGEMPDGQE